MSDSVVQDRASAGRSGAPDDLDESFPRQPSFEWLKQIATRLLLFESYVALPDSTTPADLVGIERLRAHVFSHDAATSRRDRQLDEHLVDVLGETRRFAGVMYPPVPAIEPVLGALEAHVGTLSCKTCAPGKVCGSTGGRDNDRNVTRGGQCITALLKHFREIESIVQSWMAHSSLKDIPKVELTLAIRHSNDIPHELDKVEYKVAGEHQPRDSSVDLRGFVALIFQTDSLDRDTFLAVTYVLFHELVCHAWDGALAPHPRQQQRSLGSRDSDGFADGWMDYVAMLVVEQWLERSRASGTTPPRPVDWHGRALSAKGYHSGRLSSGGVIGPVAQRRLGAERAGRFHGWLREQARSEEEATSLFIGWSLYLSLRRPPCRASLLVWSQSDARTTELIERVRQRRFKEAVDLIESPSAPFS